MPIKENFYNNKIFVVLNDDVVNGIVLSNAFNFNTGEGLITSSGKPAQATTGTDNGLTFCFGAKDITASVTFDILQSETFGGTYASVGTDGLILSPNNSTILPIGTLAQGKNALKVGVIGVRGPYYKVGALGTIAAGTVWGIAQVGSEESPISQESF